MTCGACGCENPNTLVFCQRCGRRLAPRAALPTPPVALIVAPVPDASQRPSGVPPADAAGLDAAGDAHGVGGRCSGRREPSEPVTDLGPPIMPDPVVDLREPTSGHGAPRTCARCHGVIFEDGAFCRYCGAPLGARAATTTAVATDADPVAPLPREPVIMAVAAPRPDEPAPHAAGPARPELVLIANDGSDGPRFSIGEQLDIGRTEGDVLLGHEAYASPRHARLSHRGGKLLLRDLSSTNGTFVRVRCAPLGKPAIEVPLQDQDLFLIGQQVLRFEVVEGAEEGFGPANQAGTLIFGTPAVPRYARLSQRTVEGLTRDVFHIRKVETVLGRESGDIVFTDDPFMSRRHAVIRMGREPRRFVLADLGSSNGTFLRARGEIALADRDQFRIGQQLFRVASIRDACS